MKGLVVCALLGMAARGMGAEHGCRFGGKLHEPGAVVCSDGKQHRCVAGRWKSVGTTCAHGMNRVAPGVHAPSVSHAAGPRQPPEPVMPATHQPAP